MNPQAPTKGEPVHTIEVLNGKGGDGKTTTVANLGAALAHRGLRVVEIGIDPQGDLQACWGVGDDEDVTRLEDLLDGVDDDPGSALIDVTPNRGGGRLYLLPAGGRLVHHTGTLGADPARLVRLIGRLRDRVDVVLIDTPAGQTVFGDAALMAADHAIVTMLPEFNDLRAVTRVLETLRDSSNAAGSRTSLLGVLFLKTLKTRVAYKEYAEHLRHLRVGGLLVAGGDAPHVDAPLVRVFDAVVPERKEVGIDTRDGLPTVVRRPDHPVSLRYRELADEVLALIAVSPTTDGVPVFHVEQRNGGSR